jgi:hypothetical protein
MALPGADRGGPPRLEVLDVLGGVALLGLALPGPARPLAGDRGRGERQDSGAQERQADEDAHRAPRIGSRGQNLRWSTADRTLVVPTEGRSTVPGFDA